MPTFNNVSEQFLPLLKEAVSKYGTVFLTGDVFVAFANLKQAYDPGNRASEFWAVLLELLPLALWVWAVYFVWWLLVPLGRAGVGWKVARLTIFFLVLHEVLAPALVLLFHLDEEQRVVKLSVTVISLALMFVLEHTVTAAVGGHGQDPPHDQHLPAAAPPERRRLRHRRRDAAFHARCVWRLLPWNAGPDPHGFPFCDIGLEAGFWPGRRCRSRRTSPQHRVRPPPCRLDRGELARACGARAAAARACGAGTAAVQSAAAPRTPR